MKNKGIINALLIILFTLILAYIAVDGFKLSDSIPANKISTTGFANKFGFLVLIALFVERATAVVMSIGNNEKLLEAKSKFFAANLRLKEARAQAERQPPKDAPPSGTQTLGLEAQISEVAECKLELEKKYREEDFKASLPSVIFGFLVAVAGVGALALFLEPDPLTKPHAKVAFRVVDVVLTGLLIGGGSVGIKAIWRAIEEWRRQPS